MMNIQVAIEELKMENALLGVRSPMKVARNDLAIAALREQMQREKGCEYCNGEKRMVAKVGYAGEHGFYLAGNAFTYSAQVAADDDFEDNTFVNYCPMCGRKLTD